MILSSELLDCWDRCERRFAFELRWESKAISPLGLLYKSVEAAIVADDPEQAAKDETFRVANSHEVQITALDAYSVVRHIGYLGAIISAALREKLGKLSPVEISTTEDFLWKSALFQSTPGELYKIDLVGFMDDDRLRAIAHSWGVIGELAAIQKPIHLTSIVIGANRNGRRHSAWAKGFQHPQNHMLRIARRTKQLDFGESWNEIWREHHAEISTEDWLKVMKEDGVMEGLIKERKIAFNAGDNRMIAARREMVQIMGMMKNAREYSPMRRSSCDELGRGSCVFQSCCYSPIEVTPAELVNLYRER